MTLVKLIECLHRRMKAVVRVCLVILALLVIIDAIPGLIAKDHAHTAVERFPAFWAAFGFVGCVVLIIASKAFGHAGIMQREDYYDE
jgi:hypothetical protein